MILKGAETTAFEVVLDTAAHTNMMTRTKLRDLRERGIKIFDHLPEVHRYLNVDGQASTTLESCTLAVQLVFDDDVLSLPRVKFLIHDPVVDMPTIIGNRTLQALGLQLKRVKELQKPPDGDGSATPAPVFVAERVSENDILSEITRLTAEERRCPTEREVAVLRAIYAAQQDAECEDAVQATLEKLNKDPKISKWAKKEAARQMKKYRAAFTVGYKAPMHERATTDHFRADYQSGAPIHTRARTWRATLVIWSIILVMLVMGVIYKFSDCVEPTACRALLVGDTRLVVDTSKQQGMIQTHSGGRVNVAERLISKIAGVVNGRKMRFWNEGDVPKAFHHILHVLL